MSPIADPEYLPVPYIYESRGLIARDVTDQSPPHTYLQLMNCLERAENSISSRYGYVIQNRDPAGTPLGQNFPFSAAVITLARLLYQSRSFRYAATAAGELYRRQGDLQGAYSLISSALSGLPCTTLDTSCFASAQAYLFLFDLAISLKDTGLLSSPQLIGIDPPTYTANSQPYSPLLTLIDSFPSSASYTTSGFSVAWAYGLITTLTPFSPIPVTDFNEFVQATFSSPGGSATAAANSGSPTATANFTCAAFPSTSTSGQPVTISATAFGQFFFIGTGNASATLQYSTDSGTTWTDFYSAGATHFGSVGPTPVTTSVYGLSNLNTLRIRILAQATLASGLSATSTATISAVSVSVNAVGIFGPVTNGMISLLSTSSSIKIPIVSITSSGLTAGIYTTLTAVTQQPHGLSGVPQIAFYGCSNNLCDGFYPAMILSPTSISVPFFSVTQLSATGGFLVGGANPAIGPSACVIQNLYSTPYPTQMSAWGFYQIVPSTRVSFPVSAWTGTVPTNSTATVGKTISLDLSVGGEVTNDDLIVCTLAVGDPASISNIRLQFDVNGSGYTASYYYKDISPTYYQQGVQQLEDAYTTTEQQIFADTLGLITGAPPNSTTAQLQPANLSTGQGSWVAALLRRGDFVAVGTAGQSGLDWSNITGWQLVITTSTVGSSTVSCNGIYLQWGYGPSSFGGIGYNYRYTYLNAATLTESNASPIQSFDPQFGYLSSLSAPFYLRQAAQVTGLYSLDPQVTHIRIYRRGGVQNTNWFQIDQIPNLSSGPITSFTYKDVVADASLAQAVPLVLDNDPPVTSSLPVPFAGSLALTPTSPGNTYYSLYSPQVIYVSRPPGIDFSFVPDQIVQVGNPQNLEAVRVVDGGEFFFTAILRLKHNAGEPVNVYALPRAKCNLSAIAYNQIWLAGDQANSHYLYFSKKGYPESFPPQNYIPVGEAGKAIIAVINWRGTLFVQTTVTWFQIVGGAQPYAQPTGCNHGGVSVQGWSETDSSIPFLAPDGVRNFVGSSSPYMSLAIEWLFRQNPETPLPLVDPTEVSSAVMAFYNNVFYLAYTSLSSGRRFRLAYDMNYSRWRIDDIGATSMLWERDTNTFLCGVEISGQFFVVRDQVTSQDFDDGGWQLGQLMQTPIELTLQPTFQDLGKPSFPKQWNMLEDDMNTRGQDVSTQLLFDTGAEDAVVIIPTPTPASTILRDKLQRKVSPLTPQELAAGQQGYRMSWIHQISVISAPTFYQEAIYAAVLADYTTSFDTYWLKFGTDQSKIVKQCYFDYTSSGDLTVTLYADGSSRPYYTFILPAEPARLSVRAIFLHKKPRLWRMIINSEDSQSFQLWQDPQCEYKTIREGSTWVVQELKG